VYTPKVLQSNVVSTIVRLFGHLRLGLEFLGKVSWRYLLKGFDCEGATKGFGHRGRNSQPDNTNYGDCA
jgi:hypothetical protein